MAYTNLPASREDDDVYLSRLRLNFKFTVTDDIDVFIQPQDQRAFGDEGIVLTDLKNLDVHQGYVQVRRLFDQPLAIKLGRQELSYGDQRLVSPLDWSNITRSWDGVKVRYGTPAAWIDAFYTVILEGTGAEDDQDFWGFYGSVVPIDDHELDAYVFGREFNNNTAAVSELGIPGDLRDFTGGIRFKGKAAGFDYTLEGMYQTGNFSEDDISAWAFCGTLGHTFDLSWKPRIGVEVTHATGDKDPADGDRETFDPLFPFGHFYQGFADVFSFKNGDDFVVSLMVAPADGLTVHLDIHTFRLVEERDAWYNFAGAAIRRDATGNSGDEIGSEIDLHARVAAGKYVKFWGGWSHFFPGDFVKDTPGTERPMDWLFLQMTVDF